MKTLKEQGFFEAANGSSMGVGLGELGEFNTAYQNWVEEPGEQGCQKWIRKAITVRDVYRSYPAPETKAAAMEIDRFLSVVTAQPASL